MEGLRSAWFLAIVAILTTIIAVTAPLSSAVPTSGGADQGLAIAASAGAMDCRPCPKVYTTLAGCLQMTCLIATVETDGILSMPTVLVRYKLAPATQSSEWYTVPLVSPG